MPRALLTPVLTLGVALTLVLWLGLKTLVAQELPLHLLSADTAQTIECGWSAPPLLSRRD